MRRDQIVVGRTYWDKKKGLRKVIDIGPDGHGSECVRYALLCGRNNGKPLDHDQWGNPIYGCYTYSFQTWAKEWVEFGPDALK